MSDHKHAWQDVSRVAILRGRPVLVEARVCVTCGEVRK